MDINIIDKQLNVVESAFGWIDNVPVSERLVYKEKLVNIRRELKKVRYAVSEPCSTAAFGESQMGKSYLVSAMLSNPDSPFSVTDGKNRYDFINDINPSRPNSTIEATGVITRFTTRSTDDVPAGFLKVHLLSITDIVLILCEAFYNQVDYVQENIWSVGDINTYLSNVVPEKPMEKQRLLGDDDVLDIKDYLSDKDSNLHKKCVKLLDPDCDYFNYLLSNLELLSESQVSDIIQILWNQDKFIGQLWTDMIEAYKKLRYTPVVYARFDSVLKRKGSLLDVARLDEMYGKTEDEGSEFEPYTEVKITESENSLKIEKSFFCSLIAELSFILPNELTESRPFLGNLDILDFPGARRPEQIKQRMLGESKNLSTVLRRGKVAYLFNKYSASKRINTLLFCHNNGQSAESSMGGLLAKWVNKNVGEDARGREEYVRNSCLPPLFIIGTWFNKDLEYQGETSGDVDSLKARWNRRFKSVLEMEVLRSLDNESHWFNNWTTSLKPFQNIYMLRDFKYSDRIYRGYDPRNGKAENEPIIPQSYPSFFYDLKDTFVNNEFVKLHFVSPNEAWESAASLAKDGTGRIISGLNTIAPNVSKARDEKFESDVKEASSRLANLLEQYYHPESSDEQLKQAKRQSGSACMHLDRMLGKDSYAFGKLMDTMKITKLDIQELVHSLIIGAELPVPMGDEETQIFMSAGLDSSATRETNLERLCDYLGVDSEEECKQALEGIDIDELLSRSQMMVGKAGILVEAVEKLWYEKVLMSRVVQAFGERLSSVATMMSTMWNLYKYLDVRAVLVAKVREYMNKVDKDLSVGIISDYLSVQFNRFSGSFGYEFFSVSDKQKMSAKNVELKLNIDDSLLVGTIPTQGVAMLEDLYKQKELLSNQSFGIKDRKFLAQFPQYKNVWRWEQQLRSAYFLTCALPDFDVKANEKLKAIIEEQKAI